MNTIYYFFLGAIQGLTEFLPVSSSGHLVVAQHFFPGFSQPGVLFDAFLHLGTTTAVVVILWKRILRINLKDIKYIFLATIPVVIVGIFFQNEIEPLFKSIKIVGIALLVTSVFNFLSDKVSLRSRKINSKSSVLVGLFQALAIVPGISRSGSTIFSGLVAGVPKKEAAEFSFLISIPAILGANIFEFYKHGIMMRTVYSNYVVGFLAAFVFGMLAIKVVFKFLEKGSFKVFSFYCLFLGLLLLIL